MTTAPTELVGVRYFIDDVRAAVDFCTTHLGFTIAFAPLAFADVRRDLLRLLLSGPTTSGARATPNDAATTGRNWIHLIVDDLEAKIDRLSTAGLTFRSDRVPGPGRHRVLFTDAAGNLIELFHPAPCPAYRRQHTAC